MALVIIFFLVTGGSVIVWAYVLLMHSGISESLLGIRFCCPVCVVLVPSVNVTSARELEKPESRHSLPRECVLVRAVGFSVPWA